VTDLVLRTVRTVSTTTGLPCHCYTPPLMSPPPLDVNPLPSKPGVTVRQPTWCCAQVQQCFAVLQEAILAVQLNELECSSGAEPAHNQGRGIRSPTDDASSRLLS
jgi:hypothetical protein